MKLTSRALLSQNMQCMYCKYSISAQLLTSSHFAELKTPLNLENYDVAFLISTVPQPQQIDELY